MSLYEYTVDLVKATDKFRGVSKYDLEDTIQDIYLRMLEYFSRRMDKSKGIGNWSGYIRHIVDAYDVSNLYCKNICYSGYSYIDDSNLVNKDVIRSLEKLARFRNDMDIYCMREYFYGGRIIDDIAKELGVSNSRI